MQPLAEVAPAFVAMAHRIVWCTVATVDPMNRPRTRMLHPIWEYDGDRLTGWIATSPASPKAGHIAANPEVSLTYWSPDHDTCTADCRAEWETTDADRQAGWNRFVNGPVPVGYDPQLIPDWSSADAPAFGILRLEPLRLRVMPGSVLLHGEGTVLRWRA